MLLHGCELKMEFCRSGQRVEGCFETAPGEAKAHRRSASGVGSIG